MSLNSSTTAVLELRGRGPLKRVGEPYSNQKVTVQGRKPSKGDDNRTMGCWGVGVLSNEVSTLGNLRLFSGPFGRTPCRRRKLNGEGFPLSRRTHIEKDSVKTEGETG